MKRRWFQTDKPENLIHGIGINDADYPTRKYKEADKEGDRQVLIWKCKIYQPWADMIGRCYSEKIQSKSPSYKGCSAVQEWHRFSTFKAWMEKQDWQGKYLDKDILVMDNKVYGPDTCVFVTRKTNNFVRTSAPRRGDWPLGVSLFKNGTFVAMGRFYLTGVAKNLGYYVTPEEAHQAWLKFKLEQARIAAEEQTDARIAKALIDRYTIFSGNLV